MLKIVHKKVKCVLGKHALRIQARSSTYTTTNPDVNFENRLRCLFTGTGTQQGDTHCNVQRREYGIKENPYDTTRVAADSRKV